MQESDVLYSFRRCPYAMRARLAILSAQIAVELREVVLRNKPEEMLEASPKGTVPVLTLKDGSVLEESLDVIDWALAQNDPEGLRDFSVDFLNEMNALVAENDGSFKSALDRYKYPNRYQGIDRGEQRELGARFVSGLNQLLRGRQYLFGDKISYADIAILPFIRQFAHVDRDWFWSQDWTHVIRWLEAFLDSDRFRRIMIKYPQWQSGEKGEAFGGAAPVADKAGPIGRAGVRQARV